MHIGRYWKYLFLQDFHLKEQLQKSCIFSCFVQSHPTDISRKKITPKSIWFTCSLSSETLDSIISTLDFLKWFIYFLDSLNNVESLSHYPGNFRTLKRQRRDTIKDYGMMWGEYVSQCIYLPKIIFVLPVLCYLLKNSLLHHYCK